MTLPKVSVIIPTCNRPELLPRAINSVLAQTYKDWELIVVDDCGTRPQSLRSSVGGQGKSAEDVVNRFRSGEIRPPIFERSEKNLFHIAQSGEVGSPSERIRYIKHEKNKGGAAARNTGIKAAQGEFVAFLDDDDEWLPEKLKIQMKEFENTPADVGFCFSAIIVIGDKGECGTKVEEGINDYHFISLTRFKGFLTSSLVVKKYVFKDLGGFDEMFPSHQEAEFILRITKKYKGFGINRPLAKTLMTSDHQHINSNLKRRIAGRELIIKKHLEEFKKYPKILAKQYFWLALWHRDDHQYDKALAAFKKAWKIDFRSLYFFHYLNAFLISIFDSRK